MVRDEEHLKMLEAIRRFPDDLSLRLAYADYLDGLDAQYIAVTCPTCGGAGDVGDHYDRGMRCECEKCLGKKTVEVRDTSIQFRAELIRVQVELSKYEKNVCYYDGAVTFRIDPRSYASCGNCVSCKLRDRERALIKENDAAWRKGPKCSPCDATGKILNPVRVLRYAGDGTFVTCPDCRGSGDAGELARFESMGHWHAGHDLQSRDPDHRTVWYVRVDYVYGMKYVTVPVLADCASVVSGPCRGCNGTRTERIADAAGDMDDITCRTCKGIGTGMWKEPSKFLKAIVNGHPDAIEVRAKNKEPVSEFGVTPGLRGLASFDWRRGSPFPADRVERIVTAEIFDIMCELYPDREAHVDDRTYFESPDPESAKTVLARAVARFGRGGGP